MTAFHDAAGPGDCAGAETCEALLDDYAAGKVDEVVAWSVEAHLAKCARHRAAMSAYVEPGRLERNRSEMLVRTALPDDSRVARLLRRCGIPDHLGRLLAATPSLRLSWLLAVLGIIAVVTGVAQLGDTRSIRTIALATAHASPSQQALVPFLLVAPLLVLAGVAAAFLPLFDPAYQLAVASPFSGVTLLLVRAVSALAAALVPVAAAAFLLPGPVWLPVALLLPSLALCGFALAATTVMDPRTAALTAGAMWALPALALAFRHVPLEVVQAPAQSAYAVALSVSAVVILLRHGRFELGWMR